MNHSHAAKPDHGTRSLGKSLRRAIRNVIGQTQLRKNQTLPTLFCTALATRGAALLLVLYLIQYTFQIRRVPLLKRVSISCVKEDRAHALSQTT